MRVHVNTYFNCDVNRRVFVDAGQAFSKSHNVFDDEKRETGREPFTIVIAYAVPLDGRRATVLLFQSYFFQIIKPNGLCIIGVRRVCV